MVALVAALVQAVRFDQSLSHERDATAALDRSFSSLELGVAHLRAAQAGYLATGQTPATWITRATDYATRVEADLGKLRVSSRATAARSHYDAALAALSRLNQIDGRARDLVRTDDRYRASDLIFMDAVEPLDRLTSAVDAARTAELAASRAEFNKILWMRWGALLAALLAAAGIVLAMVKSRPVVVAKPPSTMAEMLKNLPPPVKSPAPPAPPPPPLATVASNSNLTEAADLCVDLARVADNRDVPALVERAAKVLDAKGLVLWTADSGGAVLKPSLTHGYSDKVLARLGPLLIDADNVTSLAYRSMRPQAMTSAVPGHSGALAVPIMTASGCIGVLAAETRQTRSGSELIPLAKIIAAQFAALIAPGEPAAQRTAQA